MNDAFGPAAQRLASMAARLLGWRPDDFWCATPMELVTALVPPGETGETLDRATLNRMMENDNGDIRR